MPLFGTGGLLVVVVHARFVPGNALALHALSTALGWLCMLQTFVQSGRTAAFHPGLHHLKCVGSTNLGGVLGFCALLTPPCDLRLSAMTYWPLQVSGGRTMRMRTHDPLYLEHVDRWWATLFAKLRRHMHENGGPILMVQVRVIADAPRTGQG